MNRQDLFLESFLGCSISVFDRQRAPKKEKKWKKDSVATFALVLSRIRYQRAPGTTSWPRSAISWLEIPVYPGAARRSVASGTMLSQRLRANASEIFLWVTISFWRIPTGRLHPRHFEQRCETTGEICSATDRSSKNRPPLGARSFDRPSLYQSPKTKQTKCADQVQVPFTNSVQLLFEVESSPTSKITCLCSKPISGPCSLVDHPHFFAHEVEHTHTHIHTHIHT